MNHRLTSPRPPERHAVYRLVVGVFMLVGAWLRSITLVEGLVYGGAVLMSVLVHLATIGAISSIEISEREEPVWVQMVMAEAPPAPEPEPVPEPEPDATPERERKPDPEPQPEEVKYEETSSEPTPEAADKPRKVRRMVQGLSNDSFVKGGPGGAARAGTTTGVKATNESMTLDEATDFVPVPYSKVTSSPKVRAKPALIVPQEVIDLELQGSVRAEITISPMGLVTAVNIVQGLHPAADRACIKNAMASRWKPSQNATGSVGVTGVPYICTFKKVVE